MSRGRGGYYGFKTRENQAAWGVGSFVFLLGIILLAVGASKLANCTTELNHCETTNWSSDSSGSIFDRCYDDYNYKCRADKWCATVATKNPRAFLMPETVKQF